MPEPESYELITVIKRLAALLHQHIDLLLKPYDLARSQYVILHNLQREGALPTSELVTRLRVEPATLSGLIDTLESKGLVRRVEQLEDKRRKDVQLTEAGIRLLSEIPPPGPGVQRLLSQGIDAQAIHTFQRLGWQMIENLDTELHKHEGEN